MKKVSMLLVAADFSVIVTISLVRVFDNAMLLFSDCNFF